MSIFYLFLVLAFAEAVWIARRFANRAGGWANPGNKKRRPKDEFNGKDSTLKQERKKQSKTKHSKQKKWVSHARIQEFSSTVKGWGGGPGQSDRRKALTPFLFCLDLNLFTEGSTVCDYKLSLCFFSIKYRYSDIILKNT